MGKAVSGGRGQTTMLRIATGLPLQQSVLAAPIGGTDAEQVSQQRVEFRFVLQGPLLARAVRGDDQAQVAEGDTAIGGGAGADSLAGEGRVGRGLVIVAHLLIVGQPERRQSETKLRLPLPL